MTGQQDYKILDFLLDVRDSMTMRPKQGLLDVIHETMENIPSNDSVMISTMYNMVISYLVKNALILDKTLDTNKHQRQILVDYSNKSIEYKDKTSLLDMTIVEVLKDKK